MSKWLRILGLDAAYFKRDNAGSLIIEALRGERIILTRNQRLPKSCGVRIILIKAQAIREQVPEVLKVLKIKPVSSMMFTRCTICNEGLSAIEKGKVKNAVPEYVFKTQDNFVICPKCKRIYWQGTHWGNVEAMLKEVIK